LFAFAVALSLAFSVHADDRDHRASEAGPEDGILCCSGDELFVFHENQVLVTTGRAGIFRSENRGAGWSRSMDGLVGPNGVSPQVEYICQSRAKPRVVYAFAGLAEEFSPFTGIFSSDDFGRTWTRRAPVPIGPSFPKCQVDPDDPRTVYIAASNSDFVDEVWKSTDGGRTVQRLGPPGLFLWWVGRGIVYFGNDFLPGLFASTDGGATIQPLPMPPGSADSPFVWFQFDPDGRVIFVSTYDSSFTHTETFRSTDRGADYVPVIGLPFGLGPLVFDPTRPSRVYMTGYSRLYVSTDGGLTFSPLPTSDDPRFLGPVREIGVDPRGSVYLSTTGGPFRTDDGGQTFRSLLKDFRAPSVQNLAFDADGKLLVGVMHTQTVFRQDHGRTFEPIGITPLIKVNGLNDGNAVAGSPSDANVVLIATYSQGIFRTDDGGRSWKSSTVAGSPAFYVNVRIAFPTAWRVYVASPQGDALGLYRSDDGGQTFTHLSTRRFGAIAVDPNNPDILYLGDYIGGSGLFRSTDGGQTLQDLGQPGTFSSLAVDRYDSNVIYAGERFGRVLRSSDGGRTFKPANDGLAGAGVHGLAQDARGRLFVWIRGGGLFSSDDGASTWTPVDIDEALHRSGVEAGRGTLVADPRRPGRVYIGHAGVLRIDTEDRED
jgi:photosystem II stability/assembly factor-like uncharacterized protein